MSISVVQAVLIGIVYYLGINGTPWLTLLEMCIRDRSGALDLLVSVLSPVGQLLKIPKDVLPVIFAKLFSSSAATGFLLDIFKNFGPDSAQGVMSSIILSSTETCLDVYKRQVKDFGGTLQHDGE